MNLYIFNETRRGAIFGIGTYIRELVIALKDSDIHISIINLMSDKPQIQIDNIDGINYWYFPNPILELRTLDNQKQRELYFKNIVYLLKIHITNEKELIFHINYHQYTSLAIELKKMFNCKIISVAHFSEWGFIIFDNKYQLEHLLNKNNTDNFALNFKKTIEEEKKDYLVTDHTICLSNYMQNILCQYYKIKPSKISVIQNGLSNIKNISIKNNSLRKKWHLQSKEKVVLFVGRIDQVKGIRYLIRAFYEVLKTDLNCHLIIVGNGDYDTFFQEAKNICTRITFTGLLERTDLYELYQIANVGVVPSLFEPFGYVPVEMMMHELPIVATATSGLNEVVDESCGLKVPLIVSPNNVEIDTSLLAQKIIYLLQNPKEAKRLGKNGRKRYLEKYSSEVFGKNMIAFYKSLFQECK